MYTHIYTTYKPHHTHTRTTTPTHVHALQGFYKDAKAQGRLSYMMHDESL